MNLKFCDTMFSFHLQKLWTILYLTCLKLLVGMWVKCPIGLINNGLEIETTYLQIILIQSHGTKSQCSFLGLWEETQRISWWRGMLTPQVPPRKHEVRTRQRNTYLGSCLRVTHILSSFCQRPRNKLLVGRLTVWGTSCGWGHSSREGNAPQRDV